MEMTVRCAAELMADRVMARELLRRMLKAGCKAEHYGATYCHYCYAWIENDYEPHEPDCIYIAAQKYLEKM